MEGRNADTAASQTSWTFGQAEQHLRCTLTGANQTEYVLSVTHAGRCILTQRCTSPEDAVACSLEAYRIMQASGWVHCRLH
jgi:hypothetical protein